MKQAQFNKKISIGQRKANILGVLFLLFAILLVGTKVSAFDLITPSGIREIPNNDYLVISGSSLNEVQLGKDDIGEGGVESRILLTNTCIRKNKYSAIIGKASRQYEVDEKLIIAIISTESCFNARAVSSKGAQGLMQLMPFTARRFDVSDSFDPAQNIMGGVKYLRFLLKRFNGRLSLAIAAYNAGEGAVDRYAGVPPYEETQNYVKKVLRLLGRKQANNAFAEIESNEEKNKKTIKCISNKKIRSHTYAYYGDKYIKRYYLLRPNDTLLGVSRRVGIDVATIKMFNKIKQQDDFKDGRVRVLLLSNCLLVGR